MPDTSQAQDRMEDLTEAISTLLPAIQSLEARLRTADEEAMARQEDLARSLDRVATALETIVTEQKDLLNRLTRQQETAAALTETMRSLDQSLIKEAVARGEQHQTMADLVRLLNGPA